MAEEETLASLGMLETGDISPTMNQPPADIIDQMASVREEQARALQEHMKFRATLEQKKQETELRGGDLDVSERLLRVLDTTLPKPYRDFEFRGLSRHLGIDPNGDMHKELAKVVTGLDPDSSASIREAFVARIADATPGQVTEFTRGILQGKVPLSELAGMAKEHARATQQTVGDSQQAKVEGLFSRTERSKAATTPTGVAMDSGGALGAAPGGGAGNVDMAPADQANSGVGNQVATDEQNFSEIVLQGPAPVDNRTVDPAMASALGYDANSVPSAEILALHPGIGGMDAKEQRAAAKKLAEGRAATSDAVKLGDKAIQIITEEPRAVDVTFAMGPLNIKDFNAAKTITSFDDLSKTFMGTLFPKGMTKMIEENLPGLSDETTGDTIKAIASRNAELANTVLSLAYASAKAKDPTGRLSDQDIAMELRNLGWGKGHTQFKAALLSHQESTIERYKSKTSAETGGAAVDPRAVEPAKIRREGDANSAEATAAPADPILAGSRSPLQGEAAPATTTPAAAAATQATPAQQTPTQQAQKAKTREEAKQTDEEVQQAKRRFDLQQAPVEAAQRLRAAERDEARLQLAMDAAKEAKEWKEYQKLKDQKAEARREKEKLQAAFQAFARALGSGRSGGGGGGGVSMGPDQDAAAFKIAPHPGASRGPPSPGQAQSGYTYTRKRREMMGQ
jgi:hypothetical protein